MRPSSSSSSSACSSSHPASAQLQSLTLRPPPPGTLTIPPSLRLKSPPLAPPPLSRPRAPIFPPLRPRPQPSAMATERPAMPTRHLSVPPPTLYSPVRAVPLRPRLHTPNGHKMAPPRPSSSLQPIVAVPAGQVPPSNRHLVGLQSGPLSQTPLPASQSQQSLISASSAVTPTSQIERSPSAARQLQIMALSSGRHPLHGNAARASVQSPPPVVETPEFTSQSQRASGNTPPLSLKSSLVKTSTPLPSPPSVKPFSVKASTPLLSPSVKPSSVKTTTPLPSTPSVKPSSVKTPTPLPSPSVKPSSVKPTPPLPFPPSLLRPTSPPGQTTPHSDASVQRGGEKQSRVTEHEEKQEKRGVARGMSKADDDAGGGKERSAGIEPDQREREKIRDEEACGGTPSLEERMDVTEEGQRERPEGDKEEGLVDQAEDPTHRCQSLEANPKPDLVSSPEPGAMVCLDLSMASGAVPVRIPPPSPVAVPEPIPVPVSEAVSQPLRAEVPTRDPQAVGQEDYCEILSTQSDSQSALSSLSSQSSPTSPFILPSADNPPPLLPAQPATQDLAGLSQRQPEMLGKPQEDTEHLSQSGDDAEHFDQPEWGPWVPRAWPEGREVLTHLVEGFVIKEGLQPFPVNRSSLLVQEEIKIPQEVNGTNGKEVFPVTETIQRTEHSTDTDDEEVAPTEDPSTRSSHRDRTVLHCQFCGKRGHAHNFMRSKRFCSTSCARGFNVRLTKRLRALSAGSRSERPRPVLNRAQSVPGKPLLLRLPRDLWSAGRRDKDGKRGERNEDDEGEDDEEEGTGDEGPPVATATKMECRTAKRARRASEPAVSTSSPTTTFKPRPAHWSVEDVTSFIHTLPGCSEVAKSFRLQEIDGQALLLLTEDHLMTSMNIKLGPALKICAHINALKHQ